MTLRKKYFTSRPWGFGSNIVNYLKSVSYCDANNLDLILQDRYNTISTRFPLFSVVNLPAFVTRVSESYLVPISDFKSLIKYNLYEKDTILNKISNTFLYLTGQKKTRFLNNFNLDKEINFHFSKKHLTIPNNKRLSYWRYTSELEEIFSKLRIEYNFENYIPDLALQIRGGDKVAESLSQGIQPAGLDEYLKLCYSQIRQKKDLLEIYVMTDTYSFFTSIKRNVEERFPLVKVRSMVSSMQDGYSQGDFNNLDETIKIESYYFFLFELEMLRKAPVCIGSFNSNIFYLASFTRYSDGNSFISVDGTLEKSFL